MNYKETYQEWLSNPYFDEETKAELKAIENDENEIKERFYADLAFGTAGLRGIIGAGINRMNIYVVRKATQGLADYILEQGTDKRILGTNGRGCKNLKHYTAIQNWVVSWKLQPS